MRKLVKLWFAGAMQVWKNDGLPAQICNKCSAKLHISFQFKKQCEKSDAKLRLHISNTPEKGEKENPKPAIVVEQNSQQIQIQHEPPQIHQQQQQLSIQVQSTQAQPQQLHEQPHQAQQHQVVQQQVLTEATQPMGHQIFPQSNCVYIECAPLFEDNLAPTTQTLTQINYNDYKNHIPIGWYLQLILCMLIQ